MPFVCHVVSKLYVIPVGPASFQDFPGPILIPTGQSTLPNSCPLCEHSPVSGEDCKPNKALRTTIKVFLRNEEKKREALKLKEAKESAPVPVVESTTVEEAVKVLQSPVPVDSETQQSPTLRNDAITGTVDERTTPPVAGSPCKETEKDVPQQSIEVRWRLSIRKAPLIGLGGRSRPGSKREQGAKHHDGSR